MTRLKFLMFDAAFPKKKWYEPKPRSSLQIHQIRLLLRKALASLIGPSFDNVSGAVGQPELSLVGIGKGLALDIFKSAEKVCCEHLLTDVGQNLYRLQKV